MFYSVYKDFTSIIMARVGNNKLIGFLLIYLLKGKFDDCP